MDNRDNNFKPRKVRIKLLLRKLKKREKHIENLEEAMTHFVLQSEVGLRQYDLDQYVDRFRELLNLKVREVK